MDGVLAVDKPAGMTSHDVVDSVRKKLGTRKVGHAGTLDPDATGVLILGVGRATRLLSYAQEAPKRYRAVARFGSSTTTQDASGEVIEERPADIDRTDVEREAKAFVGDIEQVPPMVSAVKVGGERLYRMARRGEEVERPARPVTIHDLRVTGFSEGEVPEAELDVECSAGTFVRTLINDLGAALGCGAHMAELRRTEAGGFAEGDLVQLDDLSEASLRPLVDAVRVLPRIELDEEQAIAVSHGRALESVASPSDGPVALVHDGELVAVYKPKGGALVADRVVPT
jgi:tRNA pseudouridine55 synthase